MTDVLILGGARTPMTDYTGSLKDISALELGAIAARVGGASMWRGAVRVMFWGALAMAASALVGRVFGATV